MDISQMARIRTFKPEFWSDSKTGTLSGNATKLFLGMMNYSDDYGVIVFDCCELKARILPYEKDDPHKIIIPLLKDELLQKGLLTIFSFQEHSRNVPGTFLHISNFDKHQRVEKRGYPIIEGWQKGETFKDFVIRNIDKYQLLMLNESGIPVSFQEHSKNVPVGKERKGRERNNNIILDHSTHELENFVFITLTLNDKTEYGIYPNQVESWKKLFPIVDIEQELRNMKAWCDANPTKRKTKSGILRFVVNWLKKCQDSGKNNGGLYGVRAGTRKRSPTEILAEGTMGAFESDAGEEWAIAKVG